MTPEQERRAMAQLDYRQNIYPLKRTDPDEYAKRYRIFRARYPEYQASKCGHCTGGNIERSRA